MQAQFIVLTYNLLLRLNQKIQEEEGIIENEIERKKTSRWSVTKKAYKSINRAIPTWLEKQRRTTQLSVKFIRWVRVVFLKVSSWKASLKLLSYEYSQK